MRNHATGNASEATRRAAALGIACVLFAGGHSSSLADVLAEYRAGRDALAAGRLDAARAAFRRALAEDPSHVGSRLNLGISYARERRWEDATREYRVILAAEPGHPQANNNLGNVLFRQGRYSEAATYYRAAVEAKPDYVLAWYHLGWIARHEHRLDDAERAFRRCLETPARSRGEAARQLDAHYYLGTLHFRNRDFEGCLREMRIVLDAQPGHLEANYQMAQALLRLGRRDEAEPYLERHRALLKERARRQPVASGTP